MRLSFVPKQGQFFVLFRENAAILMDALKTLQSLLQGEASTFTPQSRKLKELEREADEITHRINRELNRTFITPFDREDIYALASAVDDVIDLAEEVADTIVLDCITEITLEARQMGD